MGVESGNRRHGDEGAYTDVRNRIDVPHVAAICAHIRRRNRKESRRNYPDSKLVSLYLFVAVPYR